MSNSKDNTTENPTDSSKPSDSTIQQSGQSPITTRGSANQPTPPSFEEVLDQSLQTFEPVLTSTEPSSEHDSPSHTEQEKHPIQESEELGPEDFPTDLDEHWNEIPTETAEWYSQADNNLPNFVLEEMKHSKGLEEWGQLHPYSLLPSV